MSVWLYVGQDVVVMPDVRLYLNEELYKKWLKIPSGQRSSVIQRLLCLYFSCGGEGFLEALEKNSET